MPLGSVTFGSGFMSGIDFQSIIDATLQAERYPITKLEEKVQGYERTKSSFAQLETLLKDLTSKLEDLDDPAKIAGRSTSFGSDDAPLSADASPSSQTGVYEIEVSKIATAHRVRSEGVADRYSPLVNDGTITIQAGGHEAITIDVSAANGNNSLNAIADEINNAEEGVIASVINDGTNDILVVRSEETGASHALSITDTTNLNLADVNNELQQAQSAELTIDGLAITSESNTVSSAIAGVSLTLRGETTQTEVLTIEADQDATKDSIQQFVDTYNTLNEYFDAQFGSAEFRAASSVRNASQVRSIQLELQNLVTGRITGIPEGNVGSLAELGITVADATGRLEFESSKFDDLVEDGRLDEVQAVLMSAGSTTDSSVIFDTSSPKTQAGEYAVHVTRAAERAELAGSTAIDAAGLGQNETLTVTINGSTTTVDLLAGDDSDAVVSKVNNALSAAGLEGRAYSNAGALTIRAADYGAAYTVEVASNVADSGNGLSTGFGTATQSSTGVDIEGTIGGEAANGEGNRLVGADGTPADGLIIQVYATAASVTAKGGDFGTVGYSQGLFDSLTEKIETYTDPFDGVIKSVQDGYDDTIEIAKDRIERMEDRLVRRRELLTKQYSAAEAAISQLQQMQASLGGLA